MPREGAPGRTLTEAHAKTALAVHGLQAPRSLRAVNPDATVSGAAELGFPVVLKGEGVAHKTEAGAVVLGLGDPEAVRAAAEAMPADSFLVEEMIADGVAELLVGVVRDPAHGYVLTLAAGGTLTELMEDRGSVLVPASREEVREVIFGLKVGRLLNGYRGASAANVEAVLDAVMAVQAYVTNAHPREVEINPLICTPDRAVAADALIRIDGA